MPPCISTSRRTSVSPIPARLGIARASGPTWVNRSNTAEQHVGRDADAGVPDADDHVVPVPAATASRSDPPAVGVLGGVVQEVREHLGEPGRVAVHPHRLGRQVHVEAVPGRVDQRPAGLDRLADHLGQVRIGSICRRILPRVIRETSSRSSTRRTMCRIWRSITSCAHRDVGLVRALQAEDRGRRCGSGRGGSAARGASIDRNSFFCRSACSTSWYSRALSRAMAGPGREVLGQGQVGRAVPRAGRRRGPAQGAERPPPGPQRDDDRRPDPAAVPPAGSGVRHREVQAVRAPPGRPPAPVDGGPEGVLGSVRPQPGGRGPSRRRARPRRVRSATAGPVGGERDAGQVGQERDGLPGQGPGGGVRVERVGQDPARLGQERRAGGSPPRPPPALRSSARATRSSACRRTCWVIRYRSTNTRTLARRISGTTGVRM